MAGGLLVVVVVKKRERRGIVRTKGPIQCVVYGIIYRVYERGGGRYKCAFFFFFFSPILLFCCCYNALLCVGGGRETNLGHWINQQASLFMCILHTYYQMR